MIKEYIKLKYFKVHTAYIGRGKEIQVTMCDDDAPNAVEDFENNVEKHPTAEKVEAG